MYIFISYITLPSHGDLLLNHGLDSLTLCKNSNTILYPCENSGIIYPLDGLRQLPNQSTLQSHAHPGYGGKPNGQIKAIVEDQSPYNVLCFPKSLDQL
jgi:hypothetical protein